MTTSRTDDRDHLDPESLERIAEADRASAEERRHLAACGDCRHEVQWLRGFQAAVARIPERRPSEGFVDRVMDHVALPSPAGERAWIEWSRWIAVGAAAMVAVTAVLGWQWIISRPDVSLGVLASLALEAGKGVLLTMAMEIGEFLVASGIAPALESLYGELTTTSALGALGVLAILGIATGIAALHALRPPAAWHNLNGA